MVVVFTTTRYPDVEEGKLYSWIALATMLLYLTWICFRHNQRVLKTAKDLLDTYRPFREDYNTLKNYYLSVL